MTEVGSSVKGNANDDTYAFVKDWGVYDIALILSASTRRSSTPGLALAEGNGCQQRRRVL